MNWPLFTTIFMIVALVLIIALDIFLLTRKQGATISEILRGAARKWAPTVMLICFGMGLLAGHIFWTRCTKADVVDLCKNGK
jgi:hypothetical protein